ncbi:FG-GAP-like repeat-containing protein [Microbacterium sp. PMB16]|uniref:FG-GAP-like repeat-containing protein n=1 Tax=Microbacterium sp. PMB16 TaxID=3120157 RepID=UPI003F4BFB0F
MLPLNLRRRTRIGAAGVAAALLATLFVSSPASVAVAADAPGHLVETGAYPDGASVGPANGLVLKDGNGGLRLVECTSVTNPVIVERTVDGRLSKVCFEAVFRPAVLNLEIESSFGVKAGAQPLEVTYSVAGGPEQEATVQPLKRGSVDVANTGESTIVVLEVQADPAVDVPATTTTHPRTAIAKIRSGLGSCTGTLVDRSWVLSAASCFATDPATVDAGAPAAPARVLFGPDVANDRTASGTGALGIAVSHVEPAGAGKDAVLVKLATPVDDITPLPLATTAPTVGQDVAFTGFGRTNNVWVPLASHTNTYPVTAVAAANLTASASAAALCVGDGGAPGIRTIDGAKKIVAVASQSSQAGCYGSGIPAGTASVTSTRADVLAPWVATTIRNGLDSIAVPAAVQAFAQQIIDSGRVTAAPAIMTQLQAYAAGRVRGNVVDNQVRNCTIDPVLLEALKKVVVDQSFSITITALNEYCITPGAAGTSYHARNGGGYAVDISVVNGVASTGNTAQDQALRTAMLAALPAPAGIGQLNCRPRVAVPAGWSQFDDVCTHNHFEYRGTIAAAAPATKPSFDVSGDGKADVLSVSASNHQLYLYLGNGAGGWQQQSTGSAGWEGATAIVHGDYNSDGKGDIVSTWTDGTVWLFEGNGANGFINKSLIGSGWPATALLTGGVDFNGDNHADLIGRGTNGNIFLYAGTGAGSFLAGVHFNAGWGHMTALLAGDFTGDGKGDLVARDSNGLLWQFPGNGTNLTAPTQVGSGWNMMSVITGGVDYNSDNKADILARSTAGEFWVYSGTGTGFTGPTNLNSGWNALRLLS